MTSIVRCTEYLKCKGMINKNWNPEFDCIHWDSHGIQDECNGFCSTVDASIKCIPADTDVAVIKLSDFLKYEEYMNKLDIEQGDRYGGICSTLEKDIKCIPESVGEIDAELSGLIESVKNLGRELAVMAATAPALRDASDRMWSMTHDVDSYFDELDWDEAMEVMWEEVGLQSEEDAEY